MLRVAQALLVASLALAPGAAQAAPPTTLCVVAGLQTEGLGLPVLTAALAVELRKVALEVPIRDAARMRDCPPPRAGERATFLRTEAEQVYFVDGSSEMHVLGVEEVAPVDRGQAIARWIVSILTTAPERLLPPVRTTPAASPPPPPSAASTRKKARRNRKRWYQNVVGWTGVGVGAIGLTIGTLLLSSSSTTASGGGGIVCVDPEVCDETFEEEYVVRQEQAEADRTAGTIALTIGGLGLAVGVTAFVVAAAGENRGSVAALPGGWRLAPTTLADGAPGLLASVEF